MTYRNSWQQPKQDTGWGLIFRLNLLLGKIETDHENGDIERWNKHIDRIYVNIIYKNDFEIIKDEKGKVIDCKLKKEDVELFAIMNKNLGELKTKEHKALLDQNYSNLRKIKNDIYALILKKDIWIRKKLFELKLYLRESESDPRKAIYN